jgi:hypothetical protein
VVFESFSALRMGKLKTQITAVAEDVPEG